MSQKTQVKQGEHKVTQVHKSDSQWTVTDYFKGNKSTEEIEDVFIEVQTDKKKCKRRRTTGEKSSNKKVYQMEDPKKGDTVIKPKNTIPKESQPLPQTQSQVQPDTSTTDPQYAALERLFTTKMNSMVNEAITKALEPLKESIDNLSSKQTELQESIANLTGSETTLEEHTASIQKHQQDNLTITTRIDKFENSQQLLIDKMVQLKNKQLEKNLVVTGIPESDNEWESVRMDKIKALIVPIMNADSEDEKKQEAENIEIVSCRRIGKYTEGKNRPMSVEFHSKSDADKIYKKKKELPTGTYVDREYCAKTERKRRLLRPILKAARRLPEYKGLCKLEADVLVLNGKKFNLQNTDKLPDKLHPTKITSKQSDKVYGFFGELNPLSNFHLAPFCLNGKQFHSSEQYIQYQKALLFNNVTTVRKILVADTALECKKLGYEITEFDFKTWKKNACTVCKPGILAKYLQNEKARTVLLATKEKSIAECTTDKLWGTGFPFQHHDSLNPEKWTGDGLLGKILEECRTEIRALSATSMEIGE